METPERREDLKKRAEEILKEAYAEGYLAGYLGRGHVAPYRDAFKEADRWNKGYVDGSRDAMPGDIAEFEIPNKDAEISFLRTALDEKAKAYQALLEKSTISFKAQS